MSSLTLTSPSPMSANLTNRGIDRWSSCPHSGRNIEVTVILTLMCVVGVFGLVGNGNVIWLLGFRMKRTPFTIYILNLAVADFGVLTFSTSMAALKIVERHLRWFIYFYTARNVSVLFYSAYSTSQFLLTAISIDRCASVLFPLWYRFHRPKRLSTVLCVVIWILSFLINGICNPLGLSESYGFFFYAFLVNATVCLPIITVSTLILFIRFCFKSHQRQRGKLLRAILLTLLFFLIFAFPLNVMYLIWFGSTSSEKDRSNLQCYNLVYYALLCASFNSFVNPLLYFLVGRKKRGLRRENLKLILGRVFMEEEEEEEPCRETPGTQLSDLQKPTPQEQI